VRCSESFEKANLCELVRFGTTRPASGCDGAESHNQKNLPQGSDYAPTVPNGLSNVQLKKSMEGIPCLKRILVHASTFRNTEIRLCTCHN